MDNLILFAEHITGSSARELKALAYTCLRKLLEGHSAVNKSECIKEIQEGIETGGKEEDWEEPINPYIETESQLSDFSDLLNSSCSSEYIHCAGSETSPSDIPAVPFILTENHAYLHRYFLYESRILERLREFSASGPVRSYESLRGISDFIRELFRSQEIAQGLPPELRTDWQMAAALSGVINRFSIITGGPGTGKTTVIGKILAMLYRLNPGIRIALAAPTGKAAARMNASLKESISSPHFHLRDKEIEEEIQSLSAMTLHRLLGWKPSGVEFRHNSENPLEFDAVIVDEASMIDAALMAKLFDAVESDASLILIGDRNQLASVEAGSVFGDLCRIRKGEINIFSKEFIALHSEFTGESKTGITSDYSEKNRDTKLRDSVTELKLSRRFDSGTGIGSLSSAVIQGEYQPAVDSFKDYEKDSSGVYLTGPSLMSEEAEMILENEAELYLKFIREEETAKAIEAFNEVRFLCATRQGPYGVEAVNKRIQDYLTSNCSEFSPDSGKRFYHNQPVMITENDYAHDLYNGDTGIVRLDEKTQRLYFHTVKSDNTLYSIRAETLGETETVFAMTIHKSQGSEFNNVFIILPEHGNRILSRELLYTGITRTRKRCVVSASMDILQKTIQRSVKRASGLTERFLS